MYDIKKILSNNVRFYRIKKGMSQEDLAFKSGLHRTYISSIECENRNVSINNLAKIANVLEVEPYELLIRREENENE